MMTRSAREQLRKRLYLVAHQEVSRLVAALPQPLRSHARQAAILYEMVPLASDIKNGIEPDTLGLFSGNSLADGDSSGAIAPTVITLYMENIWEYAGHDAATFREEVQRTYLHELGHFLGLDEDGLELRDLD